MIIITDAHVSQAKGNATPFFRMLNVLEKNDHDLIFLGDIFDMWIALPRYENEMHRNFLLWCREQKRYRAIGFIEGNHEFFIAEERKKFFSWCSNAPWWQDNSGNLFVHGDQINRQDKNYLFFRKVIKNKIAKTIIRCFPFGPHLVESIKKGLKKTNRSFRMGLPHKEIKTFAEARFTDNVKTIFVGHFHQNYRYRNNAKDKELHVLPDWFGTGKVTIYERTSGEVTFPDWQELGGLLKH